MNPNRQSQMILGLVLVVILVSSTLVTFFIFQQVGDPDEKYKGDHLYSISGTVDGSPVDGEGRSEYAFEPKGYVYIFTANYSSPDGKKDRITFTLICDSKSGPSTELYERIGNTVSDGVPCSVWRQTTPDRTIVFSMDSDLVVHEFSISKEKLELKGSLRSENRSSA